jgi:CRP-like cAMP-binding protein
MSETFLAALSPDDAAALYELGSETRFARGASILREGEPSSEVVVIIDGWVKVERGAGRGTLLNLCRAGDVLGEIGLVDGEPRSATIVALTPVQARVIPSDAFHAFVDARPLVTVLLSKVLSQRLRRNAADAQTLATESVLLRLAHRLAGLADDYGTVSPDGGLVIDAGLSQDDLASWIGASREATARALQRLRKQQLIETSRRAITVVDVDKLRSVGS